MNTYTIRRINIQQSPMVSVIVPAYNASDTIRLCLDSIFKQQYHAFEVIVVDDASEDNTVQIASGFPITLIKNPNNSGAAAARNAGVKIASGNILVFVDSDVQIPSNGISRLVEALLNTPDVLIVYSNYSDETEQFGFISDYKNLDIFFRESIAPSDYNRYFASFFCAIQRSTFIDAGGFSTAFPGSSSVEDIEFGYRVCKERRAAFQLRDLKVRHLKRYKLTKMLKTDYLKTSSMAHIIKQSKGKNIAGEAINPRYFVNIIFSGLMILSPVMFFFDMNFVWVIVFLGACLIVYNYHFFMFLRSKRGNLFAIKSMPLFVINYLVVTGAIIVSLLKKSKATHLGL